MQGDCLRMYFLPFIVSQWDNYEELYFMQDGAPPHFALPVHASIGNNFTGRWIGRGGPNDLRESPILFNMIYVGGVGPNRQPARPDQEDMTELDQNMRSFLQSSSWIIRGKWNCYACVFRIALNGSVWALKLCKNCKNISCF